MLELKRWRNLVDSGQSHHLAIILFLPSRLTRVHTHDFPEVFWIERGRALHEINGHKQELEDGDLVFIQPTDRHVLRTVDAAGFTLINLAFSPRVLSDLLRTHRAAFAPVFARPPASIPRPERLPRGDLSGLRQSLSMLSAPGHARLALDHFLLGLPLLLRSSAAPGLPPMPDWLRRASEQVQRPELFALGAPGLVKAAGRSAEHVARTVRTLLGKTPSDFVNEVRMHHAARELRVTNRAIADIALECGLSNLSYFYALFRAAHGVTPRAYRLRHHRTVT